MKYLVVQLLGGEREVFLQDEFFKLNRKFDNVSVEIKDIPEDVLKDIKKPRFDMKTALWQQENYDKPKVEEKKAKEVLSRR